MMMTRLIQRLRAAYALTFAMNARIAPCPSDLENAGLGGVNPSRFGAQRRS